jgi:hypothetical protein
MSKSTAFKLNRKQLLKCFLLLTLPLTGFAQPQEVQVSAIQNCHYLDKIEGNSGYGKNVNWHGLAKHSVLSQAEKLGTSHVVWEQLYAVGAFNGVAIAKAYNCNS